MVVGKLHLLSLLLEPLKMLFLQLMTSCNECYMQMKPEFFKCSMSWAQTLAIVGGRHLKDLKHMCELPWVDVSEQMAALFVD